MRVYVISWLVGYSTKHTKSVCCQSEELTLDKALQIAQSMETADVNACALRGSESGIH